MATKIGIISGFLGAGKTTLIKKLLQADLGKTALIENEFGAVGIDGPILKQTGIRVREINSGCICCTLAGDFHAALKEVIRGYSPERILIEPSGVGRLSDILAACRKVALRENASLSLCAAVADAQKYRMYAKNFAEFFFDQIDNARTVVLSRTQTAPPERVAAAAEDIRGRNPKAEVVTTPWDELQAGELLRLLERGAPALLRRDEVLAEEEEHHHHHHDEETFESWSAETPRAFGRAAVERALSELPRYGEVLRAKGIVPAGDGSWLSFDYVPGEAGVRETGPDFTGRLCVIGKGLDRAGLAALFGV